MTTAITVRLPDELEARLTNLATRTRRSKSTYVREALEAQIDRIEWEQRILQNVEDIRAGRRPTIPQDEARIILGLDD